MIMCKMVLKSHSNSNISMLNLFGIFRCYNARNWVLGLVCNVVMAFFFIISSAKTQNLSCNSMRVAVEYF